MTRFSLASNNLFIDSVGQQEINIFKTDKLHEPMLLERDWTKITTLYPSSGDVIELFNCVIRGPELNQLVQELGKCRWAINREGCIYVYVSSSGDTLHFRTNDFFGWSKYRIYPTRCTVWNKLKMNNKSVVVDLSEKDKLYVGYKQKLEEKEKELSSYKQRLKEMEKTLSDCNKHLEEKEKEIYSLLSEKEKELASYRKSLNEKEKESSDLKLRFTGKEEELKHMEKELEQKEKSLEGKSEDLNTTKAAMKLWERELTVLITLWERYLGIFGPDSRNQKEKDCRYLEVINW